MGRQADNYAALAGALGLSYDSANNVIYGKKGEYDILVYAADARYPNTLSIHTAARRSMALTNEESKEFTKSLSQVTGLKHEGNQITVTQKNIANWSKLQEAVVQSVNSLLAFLQAKNLQPCCSVCGQSVEVAPYQVSSGYMHLCPDCEVNLRGNMATVATQKQNKKENVVAGIVGALLGSLLGVLSIIILSRLGYVAAISGVIMAVGVLKGYELLGGKLTKKGIIIGVIIMLVMTYVGDRLDWAIVIYGELGDYFSFFDCYRMLPIMLSEDMIEMGSYIGNLVLIYVFLLIGAIPSITSSVRDKNTTDRIVKIGSLSPYNTYQN